MIQILRLFLAPVLLASTLACAHNFDEDATSNRTTSGIAENHVATGGDPLPEVPNRENLREIDNILEKYPSIKRAIVEGQRLKQEGKIFESHRAFSEGVAYIQRVEEERERRKAATGSGYASNYQDDRNELKIILQYIDDKIRSLYDERLVPAVKDEQFSD